MTDKKIKTIFLNTENSKVNKLHKFLMNFLQTNTSSFKTCLLVTRGKMHENSQLIIISPTWNDEFELPDGTYLVSNIHNYTRYIIKERKIKNIKH